MTKTLVSEELLFTTTDVFGRMVRTTRRYWQKIKEEKHTELTAEPGDVVKVISHPDEVYRSVQDPFIAIYYKKQRDDTSLVVLVKFVGEAGFGEKLWP